MSDPTPQFLARLLGLTPSQALTVALTVTGASKKVVARERGLSENTIKNHVAAAFLTAGAHTQSELTSIAWRAWSSYPQEETAMPSRLYVVDTPTAKRLIEANSLAQAIRHAVGTDYSAKVATQMDIVGLMTGDVVVERAAPTAPATEEA